ncbi:hypothetical protein CSUI_005866 [Cystoisospora suis]|uniref:Uncharacterized protein n=1 Tax=Cystoisospora suis TaxID=483139 RepID=A0A2C6KIH7_9APIC|nr:hypothetical protein CSUI_005866 [Cystoisospora suis]
MALVGKPAAGETYFGTQGNRGGRVVSGGCCGRDDLSASAQTTGISLIEEESSGEMMSSFRQPSLLSSLSAGVTGGIQQSTLPFPSMNKPAGTMMMMRDVSIKNAASSSGGGGGGKTNGVSETYPERRKKAVVSSSSSSSSRKMMARPMMVIVGGISHGSHNHNNLSINRKGKTRRTAELGGEHIHHISTSTVEKRLDSRGVCSTKKSKVASRRITGKASICPGEGKDLQLEQKMGDDTTLREKANSGGRASENSLLGTTASLDASSSPGISRLKSPHSTSPSQRADGGAEHFLGTGEVSQTCSSDGVSPPATQGRLHQSVLINTGRGRELNSCKRDQSDEKLQRKNSMLAVMTTPTTVSPYSTSTTTSRVVIRPSLQQQRGGKATGGTGKGSRLSAGGGNTKPFRTAGLRQGQHQQQTQAQQLHDQQRRKKKQGGPGGKGGMLSDVSASKSAPSSLQSSDQRTTQTLTNTDQQQHAAAAADGPSVHSFLSMGVMMNATDLNQEDVVSSERKTGRREEATATAGDNGMCDVVMMSSRGHSEEEKPYMSVKSPVFQANSSSNRSGRGKNSARVKKDMSKKFKGGEGVGDAKTSTIMTSCGGGIEEDEAMVKKTSLVERGEHKQEDCQHQHSHTEEEEDSMRAGRSSSSSPEKLMNSMSCKDGLTSKKSKRRRGGKMMKVIRSRSPEEEETGRGHESCQVYNAVCTYSPPLGSFSNQPASSLPLGSGAAMMSPSTAPPVEGETNRFLKKEEGCCSSSSSSSFSFSFLVPKVKEGSQADRMMSMEDEGGVKTRTLSSIKEEEEQAMNHHHEVDGRKGLTILETKDSSLERMEEMTIKVVEQGEEKGKNKGGEYQGVSTITTTTTTDNTCTLTSTTTRLIALLRQRPSPRRPCHSVSSPHNESTSTNGGLIKLNGATGVPSLSPERTKKEDDKGMGLQGSASLRPEEKTEEEKRRDEKSDNDSTTARGESSSGRSSLYTSSPSSSTEVMKSSSPLSSPQLARVSLSSEGGQQPMQLHAGACVSKVLVDSTTTTAMTSTTTTTTTSTSASSPSRLTKVLLVGEDACKGKQQGENLVGAGGGSCDKGSKLLAFLRGRASTSRSSATTTTATTTTTTTTWGSGEFRMNNNPKTQSGDISVSPSSSSPTRNTFASVDDKASTTSSAATISLSVSSTLSSSLLHSSAAAKREFSSSSQTMRASLPSSLLPSSHISSQIPGVVGSSRKAASFDQSPSTTPEGKAEEEKLLLSSSSVDMMGKSVSKFVHQNTSLSSSASSSLFSVQSQNPSKSRSSTSSEVISNTSTLGKGLGSSNQLSLMDSLKASFCMTSKDKHNVAMLSNYSKALSSDGRVNQISITGSGKSRNSGGALLSSVGGGFNTAVGGGAVDTAESSCFALPVFMRSPDPSAVPMSCSFLGVKQQGGGGHEVHSCYGTSSSPSSSGQLLSLTGSQHISLDLEKEKTRKEAGEGKQEEMEAKEGESVLMVMREVNRMNNNDEYRDSAVSSGDRLKMKNGRGGGVQTVSTTKGIIASTAAAQRARDAPEGTLRTTAGGRGRPQKVIYALA